jgi:hypothetical protein
MEKLKVSPVPNNEAIKTYRGMEAKLHSLLTYALYERGRSPL